MNIVESISIGVVSSLLATTIVSIIAYFRIFKPLTDRLNRQISIAINPIQEFRDITELLRLFQDAVLSYGRNYSRLLLLRAMPCELTDMLASHMRVDLQNEARRALLDYQTLIEHITAEGFEETLFGKTDISAIDEGTRNAIKRLYIVGSKPRNTTELGFHDNLT
jgi:hypothetical protein